MGSGVDGISQGMFSWVETQTLGRVDALVHGCEKHAEAISQSVQCLFSVFSGPDQFQKQLAKAGQSWSETIGCFRAVISADSSKTTKVYQQAVPNTALPTQPPPLAGVTTPVRATRPGRPNPSNGHRYPNLHLLWEVAGERTPSPTPPPSTQPRGSHDSLDSSSSDSSPDKLGKLFGGVQLAAVPTDESEYVMVENCPDVEETTPPQNPLFRREDRTPSDVVVVSSREPTPPPPESNGGTPPDTVKKPVRKEEDQNSETSSDDGFVKV